MSLEEFESNNRTSQEEGLAPAVFEECTIPFWIMIWRSKLKLVALTITSLLVISTFTPQTTRGQENPKTGKEQRKELEKKTVALLNEVGQPHGA
jgi:hypothetical protein